MYDVVVEAVDEDGPNTVRSRLREGKCLNELKLGIVVSSYVIDRSMLSLSRCAS